MVIAIAGMILSFVFVSVQDLKAKGRDSRREEDIKQIQNALGLYAVNTRLYPICETEVVINGTSDCLSGALVSAGAISGVPTDPLGRASGVCSDVASYVYCYESDDGFTYTLRHHLETNNIPGKAAGWHQVGP